MFYHESRLKSRYTPTDWLGLIAHEEWHRQEVGIEGNITFYGSYITEGAVSEYREISTEKVAYFYGADYRSSTDMSDLLASEGVVPIILDNTLSEDSKVAQLQLIGKTFRATTVIPAIMDYNTGQIKRLEKMKDGGESDIDLIDSAIKIFKRHNTQLNSELNELKFELGVVPYEDNSKG